MPFMPRWYLLFLASQLTNDAATWYYGLWVDMDEVAEKVVKP